MRRAAAVAIAALAAACTSSLEHRPCPCVSGWTCCGKECIPDGQPCDDGVLEVHTSATTSNNGAVTAGGAVNEPSSGLSCPPTCRVTLPRTGGARTLALTVTPSGAGSTVGAVTGCTPGGAGCSVTVNGTAAAPTRVDVQFALEAYTWTFVAATVGAATGSVTYTGGGCAGGATCTQTYHYGDAVAFSAAPGDGLNAALVTGERLPWSFVGWTGGPCTGATTSPCSVAAVSSSEMVTAGFTPYNTMFVTSDAQLAPGGLGALDPGGHNDGFAGGDARCQALAQASALPALRGGTYRAFLGSATPHVDAIARLFNAATGRQPRGWVRPDGRPFMDQRNDTMSFPFLDENGQPVTSGFEVVTGANGDGTPSSVDSCSGFSSLTDANQVTGGDVGDGDQFFSGNLQLDCGSPSFRLYCFGVDYVAPIVAPAPAGNFKRAFTSANPWVRSANDGLGAADALCVSDAVTYGLCASAAACSFRAVLATPGATASSRFQNLALPVYRIDGIRTAASATDLFAGVLDAPPNFGADRHGSGGNFVWSGSGATGTVAGTCNGWMDASAAGTGVMTQLSDTQIHPPSTAAVSLFDSKGLQPCNRPGRVLCLE